MKNNDGAKQFAISWVGAPNSWDPLDFDNAQNLFSARMLYATPVETSSAGTLVSRVLEEFSVSGDSKFITLKVLPNIRFEDGTPITAEDVAFAIARMAFVRPRFPVLERISGLETWLKSPHPLKSFPDGIQVEGQTVIIKLVQPEPRPLFRFTLEPFSIIPKRCVDPVTNKLNCDRPPESGAYRLESRDGDRSLTFQRRASADNSSAPVSVRFLFIQPGDTNALLKSPAGENSVIFGNDLDFSDAQLVAFSRDFEVRPIAKSWHGRFLLNVEQRPFTNRGCRALFATTFRTHFANKNLSHHKLESSIFTPMTPGYQTSTELAQFSMPDGSADCRAQLQSVELKWVRRGGQQQDFADVMKETCESLGMKCAEVSAAGKSVSQLFKEGIALVSGSTGFWPLDPLGDLQMLFTPNMHQHLKAVANDPNLQAEIRAARATEDSEVQLRHLKNINKILYENAIYNIYTHHQYFYMAPKSRESALRSAPIGVTVPYPWQVFR